MDVLHQVKLCILMAMSITLACGGSIRNERDTTACNCESEIQALKETLENLKKDVGTLALQMQYQQFYLEEYTRSVGDSGVAQIRNGVHGTRPYYGASHVDNRVATIHNHAHNIRTIGLGEFIALLNGVFFRTRHNDYRMVMRHRTSKVYGETEPVPFPPVPPEVTKLTDVKAQETEMKEWFRAWKDQNDTVRDYKKYFKPTLCYLEGAWTLADQDTIQESFVSDRHQLDAKSWKDMFQKIRFTSYTGTKDGLENYGYLPTSISSIENGTTPVVAQWNYKILCHPLKNDLPLNRLNLVDDLKARISMDLNLGRYEETRAARFQLSPENSDTFTNKETRYGYMDELMGEIPGADGYQGNLMDKAMGQDAYPFDKAEPDPLNTAKYTRSYRVKEVGAQGLNVRHRGFSDQNLFVARTTDPRVAGVSIETCFKKSCGTWFQRSTYAIPLEIVYLTPLSEWNPYDIEYKGDASTDEGKTVTAGPNGNRNGEDHPDKAYNGSNSKIYYRTPLDFFMAEENLDAADTAVDFTHVLDSTNTIRRVRGTGHRVVLPMIPGVGSIRQRYPIMPIHGEGMSVWKDHAALTDMLKYPSKYPFLYDVNELPVSGPFQLSGNCIQPQNVCGAGTNATTGSLFSKSEKAIYFKLGMSIGVEAHTHDIRLTSDQVMLYNGGREVRVITEESHGHVHDLTIGKQEGVDTAIKCDTKRRCADKHPRTLTSLM